MVNHFWPSNLLLQVSFTVEAFSLYVGYAFGETGVNKDQVAGKVLVVNYLDERAYLNIPCFAFNKQVVGALAAAGLPHVLLLVRLVARAVFDNVLDHAHHDHKQQRHQHAHRAARLIHGWQKLQDDKQEEVAISHLRELH
jgi:hypothetical protein